MGPALRARADSGHVGLEDPRWRGYCSSAWTVFCPQTRGDEYGRDGAFGVGGVPDAGRVDRVLSSADQAAADLAVLFLQQAELALGDQDELAAVRVHFPVGPALAEREHRHEAAFFAIGGSTLA